MLDRDVRAAQADGRRPDSVPARHALPPRSAATVTSVPGDGVLTQIRSVIKGLPEPILVTDAQDRVRLTNPSADRLFADRPVRDRGDLISRFEGFADDPAGGWRAGTTSGVSPAGDGTPRTLRLRRQPNRWFTIESTRLSLDGHASPTGAGSGAVHVLRDVSMNRDPRPEREAFLSIMSHELRTPITTIYAGSSVLARHDALSPLAAHTLAVDIQAEAARLYDLVEDLIVIARVERGILDPLDEPVLLQRIVDATIRVVAGRAPEVSFIRVGVTDPPPVRGDASYVEQAARDLALNAIRSAGPAQPVTLRLDHEEATGEVALRVLDEGAPMTKTELRRAFDLATGSGGGRLAAIGTGLFVARQLVESMGGRIWALNRLSGGTELGFALPIDRE
jgi:signal transduction histidine kinase